MACDLDCGGRNEGVIVRRAFNDNDVALNDVALGFLCEKCAQNLHKQGRLLKDPNNTFRFCVIPAGRYLGLVELFGMKVLKYALDATT
jgi:hypothetical protein